MCLTWGLVLGWGCCRLMTWGLHSGAHGPQKFSTDY